MDFDSIVLDERYFNHAFDTVQLFFTAPADHEIAKLWLGGVDMSTAAGISLSVEYPAMFRLPSHCVVTVSPIHEVDGGLSDDDWHDCEPTDDFIAKLLQIEEQWLAGCQIIASDGKESSDKHDAAASDFLLDEEKMHDFVRLTKDEFLQSYSYLTEDEYDVTSMKYSAALNACFEKTQEENDLLRQRIRNQPDYIQTTMEATDD